MVSSNESEEKKTDENSDNKNEQAPKDFGNVIDALHNKGKLSSLRSYQGDMAEFIKEKNESTISIALKEKERKEDRQEKEEKKEEKEGISLKIPAEKPRVNKEGFKLNLTVAVLSLLLITGGVVASLYIFKFIKGEPQSEVVIKTEIIPYNNSVTLANMTKSNLGSEIAGLPSSNGITILKISDTAGLSLQKTKNFLNFLGLALPGELERTLKDEYVTGVIYQDNQTATFLILSVNDFGQAFSGMLDWESNMPVDLSFMTETNVDEIPDVSTNTPANMSGATSSSTATPTNSSASTTIVASAPVKIPAKQGPFIWKDMIIKNKDTRGLINSKNQAQIAYTFLDKNTVLITNNLWAIGEISSAYASRSVAR